MWMGPGMNFFGEGQGAKVEKYTLALIGRSRAFTVDHFSDKIK
jgi:hypothetical protein